MAKLIYVLNGPNLNLLGNREPAVYGRDTLADIERLCRAAAKAHKLGLVFRQSNHEGELIDWIHEARTEAVGVVINAAGLTHTSVASLDSLLAVTIPVMEVHLSNIYQREEFRKRSLISQAATGVICGLGAKGYELAIAAIAARAGK
jgi:3-dehydroquinate dehydratase-2